MIRATNPAWYQFLSKRELKEEEMKRLENPKTVQKYSLGSKAGPWGTTAETCEGLFLLGQRVGLRGPQGTGSTVNSES